MVDDEESIPISVGGVQYVNKHSIGWVLSKTGKPVSEKMSFILDKALEDYRKQYPELTPNKTTQQEQVGAYRASRPSSPKPRQKSPQPIDQEESPDPIKIGSNTYYYRNGTGWVDKKTKKKVPDELNDFIDNEVNRKNNGVQEKTESKPGFLSRFALGTGNVLKQGAKNVVGNTALNFANRISNEIPIARHFLNPALGIGRNFGGGGYYNGVGSIFSPNSGNRMGGGGSRKDYSDILTKILLAVISLNQSIGGKASGIMGSQINSSALGGAPSTGGILGGLGGMFGKSGLGRLAGGIASGVGGFAKKVFGNAVSGEGETKVSSIFDAPTVNSVVVDIDNNALRKLASIMGGNSGGLGGGIFGPLGKMFTGFLDGLAGLLGLKKLKSAVGSFFKGAPEALAEGVTRDSAGMLRNAKGQFVSEEAGIVKAVKPNILARAGTAAKGLIERVPGGKAAAAGLKGAAGGVGKIARFAKGLTKIPLLGPLLVGGFAINDLYNIQGEVDAGIISEEEGHKKSVGIAGNAIGAILGGEGGAAIGATLGSVVPGLGTIIGGLVGGVGGYFAGGAIGEYAADKMYDYFSSGKEDAGINPQQASNESNPKFASSSSTSKIMGKPSQIPTVFNSQSKQNSAMRDNMLFGGNGGSSQSVVNAPSTTINNMNSSNVTNGSTVGDRGSLNLGSVL